MCMLNFNLQIYLNVLLQKGTQTLTNFRDTKKIKWSTKRVNTETWAKEEKKKEREKEI